MNNDDRELDLALAESEQENRLLRARNQRVQTELDNAEQEIHELKDLLIVERKALADCAHMLNNYEDLIRDLTDALRATPERNAVLEEVAVEFDKMKVFGDTAASFAMFVRGMKK